MKLKADESRLLKEVVDARTPELAGLAERVMRGEAIDESSWHSLAQVLIDELTATGLRSDDEPNARGLLLDELIGKIYPRK
jgi:hypothetical protein